MRCGARHTAIYEHSLSQNYEVIPVQNALIILMSLMAAYLLPTASDIIDRRRAASDGAANFTGDCAYGRRAFEATMTSDLQKRGKRTGRLSLRTYRSFRNCIKMDICTRSSLSSMTDC